MNLQHHMRMKQQPAEPSAEMTLGEKISYYYDGVAMITGYAYGSSSYAYFVKPSTYL